MIERDDSDLVKECIDGNLDAFEILVDRYQKPLFNVAFRMIGSRDDACDISQIAFVKAFQKLHLFKPEFKFFSWIYRIVINEAVNFLQQQRHFESLEGVSAPDSESPEKSYELSRLSDAVQLALMELTTDNRSVIILRHFEDLSYEEIGRVLKIPERTVKSRLFSARKQLRDILVKRGVQTHD